MMVPNHASRMLLATELHADLKVKHAFSSAISSSMDSFWGVIKVFQLGVQSNWFGLACPLHCGSPTWGALLACYLLGFLSCLLLVVLVVAWAFGFRWNFISSPASSTSGLHRLARYLHEPEHLSGSRRR